MIFLGTLFQKEQELNIIKNTPSGTIQNQANSFEWNVIEGFRENGVHNIKIINVLPVGTYPNGYNKIILRDTVWGIDNREVGSLNLPIVKQYARYRKIKKILRNIDHETVMIYSTYLPFLKAVQKLRKDINVVLIVTDLPEYYDLGKTSVIKRFLRRQNNKRIYKCLERVDQYVLLTEQMRERLPVGNKMYTVVEGILGDIQQYERPVVSDKFIITYSGTLNFQFGIKELINAILTLNNQRIELHLFGSGDAVDYIKGISQTNSNIVFHGFVSKQTVEAFYSQTHLLVNPRKNEGEYTKYSFPSKTMEYLLSGIPFLGYRLAGVPEEYYNYINVIDENNRSLEQTINEVFNNYEAYSKKALEGRIFIIQNKNRKVQIGKILEMIDNRGTV